MLNRSVSLEKLPRTVEISDRLSSSSSSSGSSNGLRTWLLRLVILPELSVCRWPDRILELRLGVADMMDVRTLVSRDMGGTLRGRYGGGGSSPKVSWDAMLRASLNETASEVSMPVKKPLFIVVDRMTGGSC